MEKLLYHRYPACTAVSGKKIDQNLSILDLNGLSMSSINSQVYGLCSKVSALTSDNYPENLYMMFVVNAPFLFYGAWAVMKGFLDERTANKIKILGGTFTKELL